MVPAVGQAALAVEVRADDAEAGELAASIDHVDTRVAVEAERAFLRRLGAGCRLPVGAFAEVRGGRLRLRAMVGTESGIVRDGIDGPHGTAAALGASLAERMTAKEGITR
jgi:hydroxymethylbilane synthase